MFIYDLKLQDKYNTCALSRHKGKYVYEAKKTGEKPRQAFSRVPRQIHVFTYICFDSAHVLYLSCNFKL